MPGRGLNHPWDPGACVCSSTLQTSGWTSVPATPELLCPWQGGAEPRAVAVPALAGPGAEPGTLQPRLLGRRWWGPASRAGCGSASTLPLSLSSPWPRERGQWQNCAFCAFGCAALSQETANCARWQSIPVLGPAWGHPCLVLWGSQLTAVRRAAPSNAPQHSKDTSG